MWITRLSEFDLLLGLAGKLSNGVDATNVRDCICDLNRIGRAFSSPVLRDLARYEMSIFTARREAKRAVFQSLRFA